MAQVAILLSTFNGAQYLSEQLDSLLKQSYQDWICYIHDDGSKDNTMEILNKYQSLFPKKFNILSYDLTGGARNNFISLLEYSKEPYTMFCDQDDIWLPQKIEKSLETIKELEKGTDEAVAIFTDLKVVDSNLNIISSSYFKYEKRNPNSLDVRSLLKQNVAAGCTMMINGTLRDYANKNQDLLRLAMHDWGIMLIACISGKIGFINKPMILYRQHQSNQVGAKKISFNKRVKLFINGGKYSAIHQNIVLGRQFAKALNKNEIYDLNTKKLIEGLSMVEEKNKLMRMKFYLDNELVSHNFPKIIRILFV